MLLGLNPPSVAPGKWLQVTELAYCYLDTLFTSILESSDLPGNFDLWCKNCKQWKLLNVALIPCLL